MPCGGAAGLKPGGNVPPGGGIMACGSNPGGKLLTCTGGTDVGASGLSIITPNQNLCRQNLNIKSFISK